MHPHSVKRAVLSIALLLGCISRGYAQSDWPSDVELARNWPVFRGSAAGIVTTNTVPSDWDGASGRNILWKTPIPLSGKNSPVVWNDSIFLSGATKEQQEVYCIDAGTGALKWRKPVGAPDPAKAPKVMEDAGYAASTMTTDGRRVFAMFATGDIAAFDLAGQLIWSKNLGKPDNLYGHASSLLMWQNRLIVQFDQGLERDSGKSALLALDSATGNTVWTTPRPVANSWTSPILISTPTGPQIVTAANPFAIAYEPEKGTELWRVKCLEGDVAPSPAYADGLVFVTMENAVASAIKPTGRGDVSKTHVAWEADVNMPDIVSPLNTGKYVIVVRTFGTVTCFGTTDGKKLWEHEFDRNFNASPLLIGNTIHLTDQKGVTHRFEAADQFKLISASDLGEAVYATPAISQNRIFIRGEKHLYCIGSK